MSHSATSPRPCEDSGGARQSPADFGILRRTTRRVGAVPRRSSRSAPSPDRERAGRGSNQWAVPSCSARNRVSGGSSSRREQRPHPFDDRPDPSSPTASGHVTRRELDAGGRTDAGDQVTDRARLTVGDDVGAPGARRAGAHRIERRHERAHGVVDVGRVDERVARRRPAPAGRHAPARRCGRRAACRRDPTRGAVGSRRHRHVVRRRGQRVRSRRSPSTRRSTPAGGR